MILSADTHTSDPVSIGRNIELDAILAVVIGGGSLAGGRIYLGMTILGALVIQALTTSILSSGLPPEYNLVVEAIVVLGVLLLQSANFRNRRCRFREEEAVREKYLPLTATIVVFLALFAIGGLRYNNFVSTLVLGDILADNAFIIIAAIGTTFVIISGGIDLSIGSMIGFVGVVMANLDAVGWHPLASGGMMLVFGLAFGALQGLIIDFCDIQPFIVTLAGLFLLRGGCFMVNLDSVPIRHDFVHDFAGVSIHRCRATACFIVRRSSCWSCRWGDRHRPFHPLRRQRLRDRRRPDLGGPDGRADAPHHGRHLRARRLLQRARRRDLRALYFVRLSAGGHRQRADRHRLGGAGRHAVDRRRRHGSGTLFGGMIFGLIATLINFKVR